MGDATRRSNTLFGQQQQQRRNRTASSPGTAPSILDGRYPRRVLAIVCILTGVAVGTAAAISTAIYMRSTVKVKDVSPFCCPGLARELAWHLNHSTDPCKNFFAYVCSNVLRERHTKEDDLDAQLVQSLITGATHESTTQGDAGRFLTSFYRSCVKTVSHPRSFFQSLASALVHRWWEHKEQVDTRTATLYIFAASIHYKLPSAIDVSISRKASTVFMIYWANCKNSAYHNDVMIAVVDALNEHSDSATVSSDKAFRFRKELCHDLISATGGKRQYVTTTERRKIHKELWNTDDLDAGLYPYNISLQTVKFVTAVGAERIRLIHDRFTSEEESSTAAVVKAAYLVWHSVVHCTEDFYTGFDYRPQMAFSVCEKLVLRTRQLWDRFAAEMLTSRERDAAARAVFADVKRSVYADVQASQLLDADDADQLRNFFTNLLLVTPMEASQVSVLLPNSSEHFGENLIRGNTYDFLLEKEREENSRDVRTESYSEVVLLGESQLLLSPSIYGYINAGSKDYELPNNARLGRILAEAIWYMILTQIKWKLKSRDNISYFRRCFLENYLGDNKKDVTDDFIPNVLGLSSVVATLNKSDWQTIKPAWSMWRISNAQFFFMLSTYYRCPTHVLRKTARLTNLALLYNEDFAMAFGCPFSAPMAKTYQCFVNRL